MLEAKEEIDEAIANLLIETKLGSNGAIYQHLNTKERIQMLESPIFLNLKWKERALGNITFCRRSSNFYLRFFAFDQRFQSSKAKHNEAKAENTFKKQISHQLNNWFEQGDCENMYAYIDPKNHRSMAIAHQFGFQKVGRLNTYIFARLHPKKSKQVREISHAQLLELSSKHFKQELFYFEPIDYAPFHYYGLFRNDELLGVMRVLCVDWIIHRLPGKNAALLTNVLPKIPFLNRIINPKNQKFVAIDQVWLKTNSVTDFEELLEDVLHRQQRNLAFWWLDENHPLSLNFVKNVNLGVFSKIFGQNKVDVMVKGEFEKRTSQEPIYVNAYDLV